jgi:hypothetical protein
MSDLSRAPLDDPAAAPRCKPDYCLNVGITWPAREHQSGTMARRGGEQKGTHR